MQKHISVNERDQNVILKIVEDQARIKQQKKHMRLEQKKNKDLFFYE